MRHADRKFRGVQFPEDTTVEKPRETELVIDLLQIVAYAPCKDPAIDDKRSLLQVDLVGGFRYYTIDTSLEQMAEMRRKAFAEHNSWQMGFSKN